MSADLADVYYNAWHLISRIKMIENIEEILKKSILWRHEINDGIEFYAYIDNELCQLTINDYPANPLYTLRWGDFSIDFDNRPGGWTFEQL